MKKFVPFPGRTSLALLVLVNLLPIAGVLFWGWDVFGIVSLYWFENVVIGGVTILQIIACRPDPRVSENVEVSSQTPLPHQSARPRVAADVRKSSRGNKFFLIPFFIFHYGMFCTAHGVFVHSLLANDRGGMNGDPFSVLGTMMAEIFDSGGKWFVLGIVASQLYSFFHDYLGKGGYRRTTSPALMAAPYGRIVVLHVAVLFGAIATTTLGSPVFLLILLILGKIALDMKLHPSRRSKIRGS